MILLGADDVIASVVVVIIVVVIVAVFIGQKVKKKNIHTYADYEVLIQKINIDIRCMQGY